MSNGEATPMAAQLTAEAKLRKKLEGRKFAVPEQTRVMVVANQKGGVGKTTSAVNLAAGLTKGGLSVLVIDIDPQGNASTALGVDRHTDKPSVYDVLLGESNLLDAIQKCPNHDNLWCVPATLDLSGAEIELVNMPGRERLLDTALADLLANANVDYVLIDCPPSLGLLTINAMVAAQEALIPIQTEYYALEGLSQLMRSIELVKQRYNPSLRVGTILLTMYDRRTKLSGEVEAEVRGHFPNETLNTVIPRSVRIAEAPSFSQTIISYDPLSTGAVAYWAAAAELAEQILQGDE